MGWFHILALARCAAVLAPFFCVAIAFLVGALGGEGTLLGPKAPPTSCDESTDGTYGAYRGCQNETISGKACVPWEDEYARQIRERTRLSREGYASPGNLEKWDWEKAKAECPELVGAKNHCRNPSPYCGRYSQIWCYTGHRWVDDPETPEDEALGGRRVWWEFCNTMEPHACYVLPPYGHGSFSGTNLAYPGFDPRVALESNTDFDRVLLANFASVAASSIGFSVSTHLISKFGNIAAVYDLANYKSYLSSLTAYFGAAMVINIAACLSFMINRCVYHNEVPHDVVPPGGQWNKMVYIGSTIFSALLTNALMDRLLLMRAKMLSPARADNEKSVLRLLDRVIKCQIAICALLTLVGCGVLLYAISLRGNYGYLILYMVITYRAGACVLAILHVLVSVKIVLFLIRVAKSEQHGNPRLLIVFTAIALSSTVVVYLDWMFGFVNLYFLMPMDSVVNDLCLTALSFSSPDEDVSDAKRVEVAATALAVGRAED